LLPSVSSEETWPLTFVDPLRILRLWPVAPDGVEVIANVTGVPVTGFPAESLTVTTNAESRTLELTFD
jgi:hypothetical protein